MQQSYVSFFSYKFQSRGLNDNTDTNEYMRQFAFKTSGYCQYGLYHDDLLDTTPNVLEAVRRLEPVLQVPKKQTFFDKLNFPVFPAACFIFSLKISTFFEVAAVFELDLTTGLQPAERFVSWQSFYF